MSNEQQKQIGWLWSSGATALLLAVGGLIVQVKSQSTDLAELRDKGSPVLRARLDVLDANFLTANRNLELLTRDVKENLTDIRRMLEEHLKTTARQNP